MDAIVVVVCCLCCACLLPWRLLKSFTCSLRVIKNHVNSRTIHFWRPHDGPSRKRMIRRQHNTSTPPSSSSHRSIQRYSSTIKLTVVLQYGKLHCSAPSIDRPVTSYYTNRNNEILNRHRMSLFCQICKCIHCRSIRTICSLQTIYSACFIK